MPKWKWYLLVGTSVVALIGFIILNQLYIRPYLCGNFTYLYYRLLCFSN